MKTRFIASSVGYSIIEISQGLLIHPYQTMQKLTQEKVFVWLAMLPGGVLAAVVLLWRLVIVPAVRLFFSCRTTPFWGCASLNFLANWVIFFCIYWQILLLYLFVRFSEVLPKKAK